MKHRPLALALLFVAACGGVQKSMPNAAAPPVPAREAPANATTQDTAPPVVPTGGDAAPPGGGGGGGGGPPRDEAQKTAPPPPPVDPKEAARSAGLIGATDQGSFSDGFDDSVKVVNIKGASGTAQTDVRDAVTHKLGTIEACYRDTLKRDRKLHGTFTVVFYVATDGTFEKAGMLATTRLSDAALEKCLLGAVNGTKISHGIGNKRSKVSVDLAFKAP